MKPTLIAAAIGLAAMAFTGGANAGVMFYTDQTAFLNATSSTTLIDFEGIVADNGIVTATPHVVGGVSFSQVGGGSAAVCGKDVCAGSPYDSALMVSTSGNPLNIDFSGVGVLTAAGGLFGNVNNAGPSAVLKLFGAGDVLLDTQNVTFLWFRQGEPHSFFGWTTDGGDVITRIEADMDGVFEAVDDLRFGTAGAAVPEPGTLALFGLGLLGLGIARRKRTI